MRWAGAMQRRQEKSVPCGGILDSRQGAGGVSVLDSRCAVGLAAGGTPGGCRAVDCERHRLSLRSPSFRCSPTPSPLFLAPRRTAHHPAPHSSENRKLCCAHRDFRCQAALSPGPTTRYDAPSGWAGGEGLFLHPGAPPTASLPRPTARYGGGRRLGGGAGLSGRMPLFAAASASHMWHVARPFRPQGGHHEKHPRFPQRP